MKALTEEEFIDKYESTGYLPFPMQYRGKSKLNSRQLKTKYKDYIRKIEALNNKPKGLSYQKEWDECRERLKLRDGTRDRLLEVLTRRELAQAKRHGYTGYGLSAKPSWAHFISRSRSSRLRCVDDNVYNINIYMHRLLDEGRSPITTEFIGKERVLNEWWKRIVPKEVFDKYKDKF